MTHTVRDWMSAPVVVIDPDNSVSYARTLMRRRNIHSVVVGITGENKSYGIVTTTDIRDKIVAADRNPAETKISEIIRGQVYASKGAYDLAIKDFNGSLRLNPKDVEVYNNRCWARTVIGDLQAALRDCNEALRLRPNFFDALDSRGLLNLKSGQTKTAIADFDAALRINPRLTSSLYGRGLANKRNGSIAEGDLDIANAKAMDPNIVKEFADYGVP